MKVMRRKIYSSLVIALVAMSTISCQSQTNNAKEQNPEIAAANSKESLQANEPEKIVLITTDFGTIKVKLYNETPLHRDNFIKLVSSGFYNGLLFHRVINQFMIQGGDPDSRNAKAGQMLGNGGPGYTIPAEIMPQYFHKKGALAAARMGDNVNPQKESSGSQFYLVQGKVHSNEELDFFESRTGKKYAAAQRNAYTTLGGTPHLDGGYTVFGEVIEGLDVIDKIAQVPGDGQNRPLKDVKMTVSIVE
jgi:peptidyl-prolyl cis-trans isomerase B (cyclophilin B)